MNDETQASTTTKVIKICNVEYKFSLTSPVEDFEDIAKFVEEKMKTLQELDPSLNTEQAALLAALNIANDMFLLNKEYDEFKTKFEENTRSLTERLENSLHES